MATKQESNDLDTLMDELRLVHDLKNHKGYAIVLKALQNEAEHCDKLAREAQTEFQHTRATISAAMLRRVATAADDVQHRIQVMIEALREEFK